MLHRLRKNFNYQTMKHIFSILFFLFITFFASAQNKLTLKEAIELGIKNNPGVNQADLRMQQQEIGYKQTKATMLPDLNASANYGMNQGRSIDPFTNGFINQNVNYSSYSASSNILLFNGGSLQNKIRENKLGFEASQMEWQQAKDKVTINIILAYLQILSSEEVLAQSRQQGIVTNKQAERLGILNKEGAIAPAMFYDVKGQVANDEIAIGDQEASLEFAKLNLCQLLNIPYDKTLQVESLEKQEFDMNYGETPKKIYEESLENFAQIKAVTLRKKSAEKAIRSAKGALFPTLYLGGNLNTNYSSVASQSVFVNTTQETTNDYVDMAGTKYPVIIQKNNFNTSKINFENQLSNNLFSTVNVGLSIPIFNANQSRNKIKLAKIDLKNSEIVEENTRVELQHSIEEAYVRLSNSLKKYALLQEQVNAFSESFRSAEIRFYAGDITSVDYLVAKNNLDRSKVNLIISKYDFVLRRKILDYYRGIK